MFEVNSDPKNVGITVCVCVRVCGMCVGVCVCVCVGWGGGCMCVGVCVCGGGYVHEKKRYQSLRKKEALLIFRFPNGKDQKADYIIIPCPPYGH